MISKIVCVCFVSGRWILSLKYDDVQSTNIILFIQEREKRREEEWDIYRQLQQLYALLIEWIECINRRNGWLVASFSYILLLWNLTNRSTPLDCLSHQETGNRSYQSIKLIDRYLFPTTSSILDIILLNRKWWRSAPIHQIWMVSSISIHLQKRNTLFVEFTDDHIGFYAIMNLFRQKATQMSLFIAF
jgi:hypothetical protein